MERIQEVPRLKIHLIEEDSPRPLCGRAAWRGGWQVVMEGISLNVCKNCLRVVKARGKRQKAEGKK